MLFCNTVSYFVSVNMLVFYDIAETKGYESLVTKADDTVETDGVIVCFEGPILIVDVATDTHNLVNQVDQSCCTDYVILQVDATTNTIGLISTTENTFMFRSGRITHIWKDKEYSIRFQGFL